MLTLSMSALRGKAMRFPMHTAHQLCPFGSSIGVSGAVFLVRIFMPMNMAYSLLTQSGGLIKVRALKRLLPPGRELW